MSGVAIFSLPLEIRLMRTACAGTSSPGYNQQSWRRVLLAGGSDFGADYLQRLIQGDRETEGHFARHFGRLLDLKLKFRVRRVQEVEDLRQETLMRVLTTLRRDGGLSRPDNLGGFVNGVCNNVVLEFYRRDGQPQAMAEEMEPRGNDRPVDEQMICKEERQAVRVVVDSLPEKDKELLRRVFLDEEDKDKVCRELNVNRDYLRVLLFRARGRFRKIMTGGR